MLMIFWKSSSIPACKDNVDRIELKSKENANSEENQKPTSTDYIS